MKLRRPFYEVNNFRDQPYRSLILIAPYCDYNCKGCQNSDFKNYPVENFKMIDIIKKISEEETEGVTVEGLEIFLSGVGFLDDLIKLIKISKIENFTFFTRFEYDSNRVQFFLKRLRNIDTLKRICVKTGAYVEDKPEKTVEFKIEGLDWSIKLASDNQNYKIINNISK